jgi:general secretion pathway protein G
MAVSIKLGKPMKENEKFLIKSRDLSKFQLIFKPFKKNSLGFTLIELMVVMTIIALLISIAVPRYFKSVEQAKEDVLKQSLNVMRVAIDRFYGDNDRYPLSIKELVTKKYIRMVPVDPITESNGTWVTLSPGLDSTEEVFDIKSGAPGTAKDGSAYADW